MILTLFDIMSWQVLQKYMRCILYICITMFCICSFIHLCMYYVFVYLFIFLFIYVFMSRFLSFFSYLSISFLLLYLIDLFKIYCLSILHCSVIAAVTCKLHVVQLSISSKSVGTGNYPLVN